MCRFWSLRSTTPFTTVGSVERLLTAPVSFTVATVAALISEGTAAPPAAAVSVNLAESEVAMVPANEAVTIGPLVANVHPAPAAET